MGYYRKKPIVIEARQITTNNIEQLAEWCGGHLEAIEFPSHIDIPTLEGIMKGGFGAFIIKGIAGEFYPCDGEIFNKLYVEVED